MKKYTKMGIFLLISGIALLQILATPAPANAACAGASLYGIAFDGANIWVANSGGNTVTKIRASDGSPVGTYAVVRQSMGYCLRRGTSGLVIRTAILSQSSMQAMGLWLGRMLSALRHLVLHSTARTSG